MTVSSFLNRPRLRGLTVITSVLHCHDFGHLDNGFLTIVIHAHRFPDGLPETEYTKSRLPVFSCFRYYARLRISSARFPATLSHPIWQAHLQDKWKPTLGMNSRRCDVTVYVQVLRLVVTTSDVSSPHPSA
ncbi:MAG: hypothetical protein MRK00_00155 [Nitrosomonas sp.]|nr:hypothetical protein [Nitrosomonas sp.]